MFGKKRRYSSTLHAPAPGPVAPWLLAHRGAAPDAAAGPPLSSVRWRRGPDWAAPRTPYLFSLYGTHFMGRAPAAEDRVRPSADSQMI